MAPKGGHKALRARRQGFSSHSRVPGSSATLPIGINGFGAVAGLYKDARSNFHGFIRTPSGVITPFDVPGSLYTYPFAINGAGAITGAYRTDIDSGFVRSPTGTFTTFNFPGANNPTIPTGFNAEGDIVGYHFDGPLVRYLIALSALRMGVSRRSTHREL